jgi:predicted ATPase
MPLKAFEVRNYRAFAETARVELRPLTLLFGYNNSGKSALARVLPLLRDSVQDRRGLPLNLESKTVRGGEFSDLRSRQTGKRQIDLVLEWEGEGVQRMRLVLQDLPERRQHVIESFEIDSLRGEWIVPEVMSLERTEFTTRLAADPQARVMGIDWRGLTPGQIAVIKEGKDLRSVQALVYAGDALRALRHTLWIGAVRATQPRRDRIPRFKPDSIEEDGTGAAHVLAWDKLYGGDIFSKVSAWYAKHTGTALDVAIEADGYRLVTGAHQVSLSDTGEGLTQVLPVLVAGAMAQQLAIKKGPSYLVVEQPELHLHPAAHAPLAEFFCEIAAASPAPRTVIETHSENFLFGVQLAVAQGHLPPESVMIYWVMQDEEGNSTLRPIQLDRDGRPDAWPREVFTEEAALARKLLEVRRQRSAK